MLSPQLIVFNPPDSGAIRERAFGIETYRSGLNFEALADTISQLITSLGEGQVNG